MANRITYKIKKLSEEIQKGIICRTKMPYLTSLVSMDNVVRLPLKHGCFNAGLVKKLDNSGYYCVYRPNEHSFFGMELNFNLEITSNHYKFNLSNCADPRLIWNNDKLFIIYSSYEKKECIKGIVAIDNNISKNFIQSKEFKISKSDEKEKNWMPFLYENQILLVSSVYPHIINDINGNKLYETSWVSPWFSKNQLRGNTNIIQLENGNYLGTFHTVEKINNRMHFYDNGFYIFEGKPPFKVLKCSNRTYLAAEDATEPHYRKKGLIQVCFPIGLVQHDNNFLISYGDNDSSVKIIKLKLNEILSTMVDVY